MMIGSSGEEPSSSFDEAGFRSTWPAGCTDPPDPPDSACSGLPCAPVPTLLPPFAAPFEDEPLSDFDFDGLDDEPVSAGEVPPSPPPPLGDLDELAEPSAAGGGAFFPVGVGSASSYCDPVESA